MHILMHIVCFVIVWSLLLLSNCMLFTVDISCIRKKLHSITDNTNDKHHNTYSTDTY